MPDADDIADDIAQSAVDPRTVSVADTSATQQSIPDKILAETHARQRAVTSVNQLFGHRTRLINGPRQ